MSEHEYGSEPGDEVMDSGQEDVPTRSRTFAEETHEAAQLIIKKLESRRQLLGTSERIGRIGLTGGVGVNVPEKKLRKPAH